MSIVGMVDGTTGNIIETSDMFNGQKIFIGTETEWSTTATKSKQRYDVAMLIDSGVYVVNKATGAITRIAYNATDKADAASVPTKTSDLTNDSGFITNLVNNLLNYYLKSETYTKAEVDTLLQAITTLDIQAVNTLPTTNISTTTIYLVPKQDPQVPDIKDEYINLDGTTSGWELIGNTQIDLSNYVTTSDLTTALADYVTSEQFSKEFFIGTQAVWNSLTVSQKTEYTFAVITDDYDDNPVGNLNAATTTDKSSVVAMVNELNAVTTESIALLSVPGLTLGWLDNGDNSHRAIRVGNMVVVNVGLDIDGVFTGTTGWTPVYDLPSSLLRSGESFITPHFTSMMCTNRRDNTIYGALIEGRRVWLDPTVDEYHLRICGQMILPIVKS